MSNMINNEQLQKLGFTDFFVSYLTSQGLTDSDIARVIAEHKEAYTIKDSRQEYFATVTGKSLYTAESRDDFPAVGDFVIINQVDAQKAVIQSILPRRTTLRKKYSNQNSAQLIATNIDTAFITESVDRDYNLNRIERFVIIAKEGHIIPIIVLNKIDLISQEELEEKIDELHQRFKNITIIPTSTKTVDSLNSLINCLEKGKTYCFLGSSGVGKSSIINKLLQKSDIKTGEISHSTGRGKHTTTSREMHFLSNGGIVIDNPGTREVGLADAEEGISDVFEEITNLSSKCRFANCTHTHEPGCAVRQSIDEDTFDESKYQNYLKLKKEDEFYQMSKYERREKDRKFGKFLKTTKKQLNIK